MPILMIPGLNGSGPDHWQSRWERDLTDAYRVMQPDWAKPDCAVWLTRLIEEVERRPGAVLVGHSLGATLIAHLAAARPDLPIGGALLVAPADPTPRRTEGPGIASFAPMPTAPFSFPAIVVASRNDPHMAQMRAIHLANLWKATFVDAGASGHINAASGHGRWPEGRLLLQSLRTPLIVLRGVDFERPSGAVIPLRRRPGRRGPVGEHAVAP